MALFNICHLTKYSYSAPVRESANQIKLYPVQDQTQQVLEHDLEITHHPVIETFSDFWGNRTGIFTILQNHGELKIASTLTVETFQVDLHDQVAAPLKHWDQRIQYKSQTGYYDYLFLEPFVCHLQLEDFIQSLNYLKRIPLEIIGEMNSWIYKQFKYIKGITTIDTTLDEIWELQAGVCQDFAHLLLAMLRMIGLPARYVSGYICPNKNGMRGEGATHAWVEAHLPFHGWVGIDPTNNCLVSDGHVKLAVGRNFADCTPVKGFFKGDAEQVMEVAVSVSYDASEPKPKVFENMEMQFAGQVDKKTLTVSKPQLQQQQ